MTDAIRRLVEAANQMLGLRERHRAHCEPDYWDFIASDSIREKLEKATDAVESLLSHGEILTKAEANEQTRKALEAVKGALADWNTLGERCEHGRLKRQCLDCEYEAVMKEADVQLAKLGKEGKG